VGEKSLKRRYPEAVAKRLGIVGENVIQSAQREALYKRKEKDKVRKQQLAYQHRRKGTKLIAAGRVANESKKKESYRPGKVPLASTAKRPRTSKNDDEPPKPKRKCGICGVRGHTRINCLQPGGGKKKSTVAGTKKSDADDMDFLDFIT